MMQAMEPKTTNEMAKAAQEVAKFGTRSVEAVEKFGSFVAAYVHGPLTIGKQIIEDHLRYVRWEREQRLMERAQEFMEQAKIDKPTRPLPLKLAAPLFQAATLEEDNNLQDLWAALLVNGANESSGIDLNRTHIDILERLTSFEAKILAAIYSADVLKAYTGIRTEGLPNYVIDAPVLTRNDPNRGKEPSDEVQLALANLARLGCISLPTTWDGGQVFCEVFQTVLGKNFIAACTLQHG
jgi:hypothetical protein